MHTLSDKTSAWLLVTT